mgnify:CR=1 FL=1
MANGYIDPYTPAGSLGGQGLQDLYSTYSQYGNLMGEALGGFNVAGQEFGLEAYDYTQEGLAREKYREDYQDFTRSIGSLYSEAEKERAAFSDQIGKAGFAGSGNQSMQDFQAGLGTDIRDLRLGIEETRLSALENISGLREQYQDEVYNTYSMFLQTEPEETPPSEAITDCYAQGLIYDTGTGDCIAAGDVPSDWVINP